MPEPIDVFADAFKVQMMPFGCTLTFSVSSPDQPTMTDPKQLLSSTRVVTMRLTPELIKGMAFILREQVVLYEKTHKVLIDVPADNLKLAGLSLENWNRFWGYTT